MKTNAMFTELFGLAAIGTPQIINIGTYQPGADPTVTTVFPVLPIKPGETSQSAFTKINTNFTALFVAVGQPAFQEVIKMGTEHRPVLGTGDPARVAWFKVNANFVYLYAVL